MCWVAPAWAGDITITPSIAIDEKFTDNVLATSANRKGDFITTVNPGLRVDGKGNQFNFGLDYEPGYDLYASHSSFNGWRHEGIGLGTAELVKDWLFLDARGAISEENANPIGPGASLDRTAPSNRLQVGTWSVAPSLRHAFADQLLAQLTYRHDQVSYANSGTGSTPSSAATDSTGDGGRLELRTGEAYLATQAGYTGTADRVDRDNKVFTHTSHAGNVEQMLVDGLGLLAHVGHDHVSDPQVDGDRYSGVFYGGGLHWTPNKDSDLRAEVGERYDGLDVAALGALKVGGRTTLKVSQQTNLQTEEQAFANSLGVVERDPLGHFIDPFSGLRARPTASPFSRSSSVFKQRRTDLAVINGDDNTAVTLAGGLINRKSVSSADFGTTSAWTVSLTLDHRIREDLSATALVGWDDVYQATTPTDQGKAVRGLLGLTYMINPKTSVRASYRYVGTQPDQGAGVHENMVTLGGRMTF